MNRYTIILSDKDSVRHAFDVQADSYASAKLIGLTLVQTDPAFASYRYITCGKTLALVPTVKVDGAGRVVQPEPIKAK